MLNLKINLYYHYWQDWFKQLHHVKVLTLEPTPGGIRTHTWLILSQLSLPLEYRSTKFKCATAHLNDKTIFAFLIPN